MTLARATEAVVQIHEIEILRNFDFMNIDKRIKESPLSTIIVGHYTRTVRTSLLLPEHARYSLLLKPCMDLPDEVQDNGPMRIEFDEPTSIQLSRSESENFAELHSGAILCDVDPQTTPSPCSRKRWK